jgi:uncharacterized protein (TIGR03435 family)
MRLSAILLSLPLAAALAQGQQNPDSPPRPAFEVATIKPAAPDARGRYFRPGPGGGISITNMPLKDMIEFAWSVQPFQVSGGPGWIDSTPYDIVAKPETRASQSELPVMLQALLADRFQLRVRHEKKEMPIYALVLARKDGKLGPDLVETKEGSCQQFDPTHPPPPPQPGAAPPRMCGQMMVSPIALTVISHTISDLTPLLSRLLGRTVVDETGLKGNFDINLAVTPDAFRAPSPQSPGDNSNTDSAAPSVFTAFQERLGLKFESKKGPVEMIVIEKVEKPSEN